MKKLKDFGIVEENLTWDDEFVVLIRDNHETYDADLLHVIFKFRGSDLESMSVDVPFGAECPEGKFDLDEEGNIVGVPNWINNLQLVAKWFEEL